MILILKLYNVPHKNILFSEEYTFKKNLRVVISKTDVFFFSKLHGFILAMFQLESEKCSTSFSYKMMTLS